MLFIYLYHGDLYSDLWKSDLYFRPAVKKSDSSKYEYFIVLVSPESRFAR